MKSLFAIAMFFGLTAGAMAADGYSDYRNYFDAKPVSTDRTKHKSPQRKRHSIEDVDTRRFDDGLAAKEPDNLKPGYRNRAGFYVPPTYSTHPRGPSGDGFGSSAHESSGSETALNPFVGPLGTRR